MCSSSLPCTTLSLDLYASWSRRLCRCLLFGSLRSREAFPLGGGVLQPRRCSHIAHC
jgi:hypothetical protein